jgi:hypothetical protein
MCIMKSRVFWVVTLCSLERVTFRRNMLPLYSGPKSNSGQLFFAGFLLDLLFDSEDGADMHTWNVRLYLNYLAWEFQIQ